MAEEERIPTSAAVEATASAAAATASGPSAGITNRNDEPKTTTAVAAASATDGSKQKQQHQHQQQQQQGHGGTGKQRRRNKTKNNNYNYNSSNANANRPGAYVPVSHLNNHPTHHHHHHGNTAAAATTARGDDRAARRSALIGALTPQLEYYFSPANLLGDTYLRTLMDLNSGYVPVGVIVNFGNVQRLVGRWDGADGSGGIVAAEPAGIQSLIREAADRSALLDVVWIDGSGRKVADEGAADADAAADTATTTAAASNKSGDDKISVGVDNGAAAGEGGEQEQGRKAQTGNKGGAGGEIAKRIAIGPKNAGSVSGGGGVMTGPISTATATPHGQQLPQKQHPATTEPGQSVVILRDAPAATTAADIRSVFTSAKASVTAIHSDVGNTWFVTLNGENTNKDDVITLLLSLRGMKLHGEPIKARLKAESVAARRPVGPGGSAAGSGYVASAPQSPVAAKSRFTDTGRQHQQQGGEVSKKVGHRGSGTGSAWDKQGGGGGGGGSRQPHLVRQSRSVPSSPAGRSQLGGGGKTEVKGGKTVAAPITPGGKPRSGKGVADGGGSGAVGGKSTGNKKNIAAAGSKGAKAKASAAVPPPPLADLHFPALGGEEDGENKPASHLLVQHRPKESAAENTALEETGEGEEGGAENVMDSISVPAPSAPKKEAGSAGTAPTEVVGKKPVSGYAAALLRTAAPAPSAMQKAAQPASVSTVGSEGTDEKKAAGARGKELKLPPSTGGKGPSSRASVPSTAIMDDSSVDDKSSVSSKTESLGCVPVVAAVAPSWGGGKTFADVLKKKEQGAAATGKK